MTQRRHVGLIGTAGKTVTDRDLSPDQAGFSPKNSNGLSLPFHSTERSSPSRVRSRRACWHALDRSGPFHRINWTTMGKTATDHRSQCYTHGGKIAVHYSKTQNYVCIHRIGSTPIGVKAGGVKLAKTGVVASDPLPSGLRSDHTGSPSVIVG